VTISTIIRTYNRASLLEKAVNIALGQTGVEQEIIVVDDGSTDGTEEVASRLPVRYLRHAKNQGCTAAANTGLLAATGDHVAFLDTDDEWHPDYLRENSSNADVSFCDCAVIDLNGKRSESLTGMFPAFAKLRSKTQIQPEEMYLCLLEDSPIRPSASVIRRQLFHEIGMMSLESEPADDWEFFMRAAQSGASFRYLNKPLVTQYYQSDSAHIVLEEKDRLVVIKILSERTSNPAAFHRLAREYANLSGYYRERKRRKASVKTALSGFRLTHNPRFLLQAVKGLIF
jgi:glycosyltransferase involved in cell wall biosynthesis